MPLIKIVVEKSPPGTPLTWATLSPAQRRIMVTLFRRGRLRRGELLRRARATTTDLRPMRVRGTLSFLGLVDVDVARRWFLRDPGWRAIGCCNVSTQLRRAAEVLDLDHAQAFLHLCRDAHRIAADDAPASSWTALYLLVLAEAVEGGDL